MPLGTSLAQTFASLSATSHVASKTAGELVKYDVALSIHMYFKTFCLIVVT